MKYDNKDALVQRCWASWGLCNNCAYAKLQENCLAYCHVRVITINFSALLNEVVHYTFNIVRT